MNSIKQTKSIQVAPLHRILAVAAGATFCLSLTPASATLTYDLRAVSTSGGGSFSADGKTVQGVVNGSVITYEVWAQVTTAAGTGEVGYQAGYGSVLGSNGGNIRGNTSALTLQSPFNSTAQPGLPQDLDGDGDLDLGQNGLVTASSANNGNQIKFRSDPTAPGLGNPLIGGVQTNVVHAPSLVFQPVTNGAGSGFEFKLGVGTFTVSSVQDPLVASPIQLNWRTQTFTGTVAFVAGSNVWAENGALKNGSTGAGTFFAGAPISIGAVPEPSAFGMLALGALGLVGFRRLGLRRA